MLLSVLENIIFSFILLVRFDDGGQLLLTASSVKYCPQHSMYMSGGGAAGVPLLLTPRQTKPPRVLSVQRC